MCLCAVERGERNQVLVRAQPLMCCFVVSAFPGLSFLICQVRMSALLTESDDMALKSVPQRAHSGGWEGWSGGVGGGRYRSLVWKGGITSLERSPLMPLSHPHLKPIPTTG